MKVASGLCRGVAIMLFSDWISNFSVACLWQVTSYEIQLDPDITKTGGNPLARTGSSAELFWSEGSGRVNERGGAASVHWWRVGWRADLSWHWYVGPGSICHAACVTDDWLWRLDIAETALSGLFRCSKMVPWFCFPNNFCAVFSNLCMIQSLIFLSWCISS